EQRIARVHRMGQHRPVQVINLVTRGSIEERVLQTLSLKRSLLEGLFSSTTEEVSFAQLGQQAFLDTVRTLVGEEQSPPLAPVVPVVPTETGPDPRLALVQTGVQFLEALAGVIAAEPQQTVANSNQGPSGLASLVT